MRRALNVLALMALVALTNVATVYLVTGHSRGALAGPTDPSGGLRCHRRWGA